MRINWRIVISVAMLGVVLPLAMSQLGFGQTTATAPATAVDYVISGGAKMAKGDYDGAIADYGKALTIEPNKYIYINRGNAKFAKGDLNGAIADFDSALALAREHDPFAMFSDAFYYRGRAEYERGLKGDLNPPSASVRLDLDAALGDFACAPDFPMAWYYRANAESLTGNRDAAIADYGRAIRDDPKNAMAHFSRGVLQIESGKFDAAISDLTHALELDPHLTKSLHYRGIAKQSKGDLDGAIADWTLILQGDPKNAATYRLRADAKRKTGDLDGALADIDAAMMFEPKSVDYYTRAFAKEDKGDTEGAAADFARGDRLLPRPK